MVNRYISKTLLATLLLLCACATPSMRAPVGCEPGYILVRHRMTGRMTCLLIPVYRNERGNWIKLSEEHGEDGK